MKKLVLLAAISILSSCAFVRINGENRFGNSKKVVGTGVVTTSEYSVADFEKISMSISADIYYLQAEGTPSVRVEAYENLQEYLKFSVNGNTLEIRTPKDISIRSDKDIKVYVSSASLSAVSIAGSGDFNSDRPISTDYFEASIAGSGDIEVNGLTANSFKASIAGSGDIDVNRLDVVYLTTSIAGSGDIELSGKAQNANFSIAGSGDIDISRLEVDHMDTKVSGSGSIHK